MPAASYLIAMCDVLGFTSLVAATSLAEIRERYLALVAQLEPHPLFRIRTGTYEREIVLNRVVFSDTILLWAPSGDTMELLPYVLGQIIGKAVSSLPLRAGLAFGDHRPGQRALRRAADHRRLPHRASAGMDGWCVPSFLLAATRLSRRTLQGV
jgi:hypothetical protein